MALSQPASDALLIANAVFFAGMGLLGLASPSSITSLVGLPKGEALPVDARNETRAVYGGFGVAVAAVLGVAVRDPAIRKGVSLAVGAALTGMAGGRIVSGAVDRKLGRMPALFFVTECGLAAMLFAVFAGSA